MPFAGAFGTAQAALKVREGFILRLGTAEGLVGLGDAAPLPEFGGGYPADVERWLVNLAPGLPGKSPEVVNSLVTHLLEKGGPGAAATAFALETAAFDVLSQAAGLPLSDWLASNFDLLSQETSKSVPVNATIGQPDNEVAAQAARQAVEAGFSCVKLKVGLAKSVAGEVERVGKVRQAIGPGVKLRLDANGGWSVTQAIETLNALEQFDLELVEQPVTAIDVDGLAQVRRTVKMPIAADEPVTSLNTACRIIEAKAADFLVIKPMVVGGLRAGLEISKLARAAGVGAIVTTTIDSAVGIAAALHLAANLPAPVPYCGLATAPLLTGPLVEMAPAVVEGQMLVPSKPGLGIDLNFPL
ncbi:MAG: mandelate racemase/muconate lactonizing enzyme family protein [Chloroflexi bacterium]|nr:mandelate racemase/muconate lactonizing enzyme family protein [Chloroflexota bacterium]